MNTTMHLACGLAGNRELLLDALSPIGKLGDGKVAGGEGKALALMMLVVLFECSCQAQSTSDMLWSNFTSNLLCCVCNSASHSAAPRAPEVQSACAVMQTALLPS
jgi:hypothetical protein